MPVAVRLVDHVEAGAAVLDLLDVVDADAVFVEEFGHLLGVHVVAQRSDVVDVPVAAEACPCVPGGVERVAGIAEAVEAVLAARHFDHALADADEPGQSILLKIEGRPKPPL
jgi:hypothetical protein